MMAWRYVGCERSRPDGALAGTSEAAVFWASHPATAAAR